MKILLAIDGSDNSMKAVQSVASRMLSADTTVHIVTAYDKDYVASTTPGTVGTVEFHEASQQKALEDAKHITHDAFEIVKNAHPNTTVTVAQVDGEPQTVILEEAKSIGSDLIVMGSKGHNAVERLLLGSVSADVMKHAHCSVEVVR